MGLGVLLLTLLVPMSWSLTGYQFEDNRSDKRYVPENGEMVYELPTFPTHLAACFSVFINFNRYSSLVPIMDIRTSYEEDNMEFFYGKPDMLRILWKSDFLSNGTSAKNIRLKWLSICLNFNYLNGTVGMYLNGEETTQRIKKPITLPENHEDVPLIIRFGHYYYDDTPLIGTIVDINMWDRLLSPEEGLEYTACQPYSPTPPGNLVNSSTEWNITGSLIRQVSVPGSGIICSSRTLLIPVRYRTAKDAMAICQELGDSDSFLAPFPSMSAYEEFYSRVVESPATMRYCFHGGRVMTWLPYQGWDDITGQVNVTYYGSGTQLQMHQAWRKKNPKSDEIPYCVIARMGYEANQSWVDSGCDLWDSPYGWDRAPCSACTIPNHVSRNIEFQLRGLCDRSGFDASFMVTNDKATGLISYIGKKHTVIQYDQDLYQWNMSVANNPTIQAVSYSEMSSMVIGKHVWDIRGDYACSTKPQQLELSLSSCTENQFTCSDGVCIDILARCDNINDCRDKSDEANCARVKINPKYQKFIVPPPNKEGSEKTDVKVGVRIESFLDINEVDSHFQVQFYLNMKWFDSRLKFKNLKNSTNLNGFLPSENTEIWVPTLVFENTEEKPSTVSDEKTTIKVDKKSEFKPSEISENENIQYFAGSKNEISMTRFYNQKFMCDYQMAWYPFDIQRCHLKMSMKLAFAPFTALEVEDVLYEGETFLTKYVVSNITMDVTELGHTQAVVVEITLGRQLLGVMLNVFVPTLVLNIISYSTNFYKDSYFESVIAINLTSMLVLVALFVQVNQSLPATSYIKMIDIWLIFNLIVPFVYMILHTYMDTLRTEEPSNNSNSNTNSSIHDRENGPSVIIKSDTMAPTTTSSKWGIIEEADAGDKKTRLLRICYHLANIIIPIIAIIFILIFFITGVVHASS